MLQQQPRALKWTLTEVVSKDGEEEVKDEEKEKQMKETTGTTTTDDEYREDQETTTETTTETSTTIEISSNSTPNPAEERRAKDVNRMYLIVMWMSNFTAFSVLLTIGNQYIKLLVENNTRVGALTPQAFLGVFMGVIYLAQTATCFALGRFSAWQHRRALVYAAEALAAAMCILVAEVAAPAPLFAVAAVLGAYAGLANLGATNCALRMGGGVYVGLNELVLTVGGIVLPPVAGLCAAQAHNNRVPYWLAAALLAATMLAQEAFAAAYSCTVLAPRGPDGAHGDFAPLPTSTPSATPSLSSSSVQSTPRLSLDTLSRANSTAPTDSAILTTAVDP